jgi:hypothetical protein
MADSDGTDGDGVRDSDSPVRAGGELPAESGAKRHPESIACPICIACAVTFYSPYAISGRVPIAFAEPESCTVCRSVAAWF